MVVVRVGMSWDEVTVVKVVGLLIMSLVWETNAKRCSGEMMGMWSVSSMKHGLLIAKSGLMRGGMGCWGCWGCCWGCCFD